MKFQGTSNYVATQDLMLSVNASITLKRPLLVKGEPGTGKTMLAEEVAQAVRSQLAAFKVPKSVHFVDDLPRNAMGKVQKALLREQHKGLFRLA